MTCETGCGCHGACTPSLTLDPHKRVHYSQGQVLGVDEFVQEEYYFVEGARRHHRTLHGYGTVCGLGVSASDKGNEVEIRVAPGHGIDTHGRELHVTTAQCASLDAWIAGQTASSPPLALPSPAELDVWVVLCYRECLTDQEPIPSGPCRTPEESMTPTRVTESFSIRFDLQRPDMARFDAIRAFAALIGRLDPMPGGSPAMSIDDFLDEVEAIGTSTGSPPSPASPTTGPIEVPEDQMGEYLAAAFHAWVTVVRPALLPDGTNCAGSPGGDGCIALARLRVPVTDAGGGAVALDGNAAAITVEDVDRPLLLSTQLIQELLIPASDDGGVIDHDALNGLADDDHLQYLLIQPRTGAGPSTLVEHLSGNGTFRLQDIPQAAVPGDAMPWGQGAGGDLTDNYPNPTVKGLHGLDIPAPDDTGANDGMHLTVENNGTQLVWAAAAPPAPGDGAGEENLVRLQALSWLHGGASDLRFDLQFLGGAVETLPGIAVAFWNEQVGDSVVELGVDGERNLDLGSLDANSFRIYAEVPDDRLGASFAETQPRARLRLPPVALIPIKPDVAVGQTLFGSGSQMDTNLAPGAFLRIDDNTHAEIVDRQLKIWVELDGDHVRAFTDSVDPEITRAVDTEFLRSRLPTGDRPEGAKRGTQGGLFSSWINFADTDGISAGWVNVNEADASVLSALGIANTSIEAFLQRRRALGRFSTFDEINAINGISDRARRVLTNPDHIILGAR